MRRGRVHGPYSEQGRWRVVVVTGGERATRKFESKGAAEAFARELRAELARAEAITVADALEQYQQHLINKGNKTQSVIGTVRKLESMLGQLTELRELTPRKAAAIYQRMVTEPSRRTGRPLAPDSHRNMLAEAKTFCAWCCRHRLMAINPFEKVDPVGRRTHGKPQLRLDEARAWCRKAFELADLGDEGAVAALMTLMLALRAGEVISRVVRDLDDRGRLLWIPCSKTAAGRRQIEVPSELRPYLLQLTIGKAAADLLFPGHWRDWPRKQVLRICRMARVPDVCAHAMRGLHGTLAIQAGVTPHLVAASLGHETPSTTLESYAQPGSLRSGQAKAMWDRLKVFPESSLGTGGDLN